FLERVTDCFKGDKIDPKHCYYICENNWIIFNVLVILKKILLAKILKLKFTSRFSIIFLLKYFFKLCFDFLGFY
ncbi:hypothetical protein LRB49_02090, partial [Borreliella burgdorferi]|uniref:hypothetical protein n=1 Tax=Borreliella burgdorferi TaxID=139 RepID=UPI001E590C30